MPCDLAAAAIAGAMSDRAKAPTRVILNYKKFIQPKRRRKPAGSIVPFEAAARLVAASFEQG